MSEGYSSTQTAEQQASEAPVVHQITPIERQTRANELSEVVSQAERKDDYAYVDRQTLARQRAALVNLPDHMEDYLRGHIYVQAIEDRNAMERKGIKESEKPRPTNLELLRGEIFELLVEGDPALNSRSKAAEQFLAVMHDPARYNCETELGHVRNPDLAVIKDDGSGRMVVTEYGEAKLARIDRRGFEQIINGGLRNGVTKAVGVLKQMSVDELAAHGLTEIAKATPIGMAEQVTQTLVVPADRETEKPSRMFSQDIIAEQGPSRADAVLEQLLRQSQTQVKKSAFTGSQVEALARYYLEKLNLIEKDNPKFTTPERSGRH